MERTDRPTPEDVAAADGLTIPDVVADGLLVLFVGINPGRYSGATGHHFARPGNRFWKALHRAGFTDRVWSPDEDRDLPSVGLGVTNLVARTTRAAAELDRAELRAGAGRVERLASVHRPTVVAVLGIGAFRTAFDRPRAVLGAQPEHLGPALLWVLPNPSGLNAHHQLDDLGRRFRELRDAAVAARRSASTGPGGS
ncbi:MAG TPA: G/U mismatch-specific DNA glycosylase [Actinomycetota bacterium]|nr:G/U mismatch-specific DNA glycosylase [Actinomycetota bacterium]